MTGKDLIKFIQENALETEDIKIEYFSYAKKVKFCSKCSRLVNLNNFHRGSSDTDPEKSSSYRFICKSCLNGAKFQEKYRKQQLEYRKQKITKTGYVTK